MRDELISNEKLEAAKKTAIKLTKDNVNAKKLLESTDLKEIESGIKKLNEYKDKCWLLSALLLYTKIYDMNIFEQSGLSWTSYLAETKVRLGLDKRDVSEQLSSARFFMKYQDKLIEKGWNPVGSASKLARGELALELSDDLDGTIDHIVNGSFRDFKEWYSSFKVKTLMYPTEEPPKKDVEIEKNVFKINGKVAVTISEEIDEGDKLKLQVYLNKIFNAMKQGVDPMEVMLTEAVEAKIIQQDLK